MDSTDYRNDKNDGYSDVLQCLPIFIDAIHNTGVRAAWLHSARNNLKLNKR
jgi:hypothetical protein